MPYASTIDPHAATGGTLLLFLLAREGYALPVTEVSGVLQPGEIRPVPGAPREVLGLAQSRGALLTVLDLMRLLNDGPGSGQACLIKLAAPHEGIALHVPAPVWVGHLPPAACPDAADGAIEVAGRRYRLLETSALIERICTAPAP